MDTQKQSPSLTDNSHSLPPAHLWIGQHEHAAQEVTLFLQKTFCEHNGCQTCRTCMQIRDKQHHAIRWFFPDKSYTIEQLDDLFTTIAYSLSPNEKFFFVIQKADFLTNACANKLLKPMEEPPAGYHFILLTEHAENMLPTIISRCVVQTVSTKTENYAHHTLFKSFTTQMRSPAEFSKIIDYSTINEKESYELFNEIFHYWMQQYKNADNNSERINAIITILKKVHKQFPMPGSSIIFWRNVYLHVHTVIHAQKETH